jgi:ribose-phosphate pyrophosphokinase
MLIFALKGSAAFGEKVAAYLQVPLARLEETDFDDGEHKVCVLEDVSGRDAFVIHSLYAEPGQSCNDKICRLLFFIGTLRDAGASSVTALMPYFAYARQDRSTEPGAPVTLHYMARLLEAAGAARVVSLDIHNLPAYLNAFRIPAVNLEAQSLFAGYFAQQPGSEELVVVSPDSGGIKRAQRLRDSLSALLRTEVGTAFIDKKRSAGRVSGELQGGDVQGRLVIILDDIISTGATITRALAALTARGANKILVAATHGIFAGKAPELLAHPRLEKLVITDSIPPFRLAGVPGRDKLVELSVAPLFAETIRGMYESGL